MTEANQRPVIVTGGASGIGRAIVERLLSQGHPVAVFDLSRAQGFANTELLHPFELDITDHESVVEAVGTFAASAGTPYALINNAGWDRAMPFIDSDPQLWDRVMLGSHQIPLHCPSIVLGHALAKVVHSSKCGLGTGVSLRGSL